MGRQEGGGEPLPYDGSDFDVVGAGLIPARGHDTDTP